VTRPRRRRQPSGEGLSTREVPGAPLVTREAHRSILSPPTWNLAVQPGLEPFTSGGPSLLYVRVRGRMAV